MSKQKVAPKSKSIPVKPNVVSQRVIIGLIFLFCFILYGNSISNNYSLDDEIVTLGNVHVHKGLKGIPEIFTSYHAETNKQSYGYRPIVLVTFAIEYQFFKQNPHVSHFVNILLYALCCCVLYNLLKRLLYKYHHIFLWVIMLLFIAHPLHSEVVDNIKSRDDILAFLFMLLATGSAMKYFETGLYKHFFYLFLYIFLSSRSKMSGLTFVAIIPLMGYFFEENFTVKKMLYFLGAIAATAIIIFALKNMLVGKSQQREFLYFENPLFYDKNILHRVIAGFCTYFYYIKLHVFPHPLVYYYGYNVVELTSFSNPALYISIVIIGLITYYAIKTFKQKHILSFAFLYFIIGVSMYANVLKPAVGMLAERFMYIPSLGFCIVLAYGIFKFFKIDIENKTAKIVAPTNFYWLMGVILVLYSGKVISRNKDWKDHLTLYSHDIENVNESAKAHALLAARIIQELNQGNFQNVKEQKVADVVYNYKEALRIFPNYVTTLNNLGSVYFIYYNDYKTAMPYFKRSIELDSSYVEAFFNLASTQERLGDPINAEKHFLKALAIDPNYTNSYIALTKFYLSNGRKQDAVNLNKTGISKGIQPGMLYINLGNISLAANDTTEAIQYYESAIANKQFNLNLCNFVANYYNNKKDYQKTNYYLEIAKGLKNQKN